ncbi:MAG: sulfate adenylyltransferase [Thermaerobacter sp.]|nr:sulfate adenylyltransferase [Thermaerobacter sp.]
MPILPHGGTLIDRRTDHSPQHFPDRPVLTVDEVVLSDIYQIGIGAFSPLTGFMGHDDYVAVRDTMHLTQGLAWTIPVTLAVSEEQADRISLDRTVHLADAAGNIHAALTVTEKYRPDRGLEAERVFRTTDRAHPGVDRLLSTGPVYLGGPLTVYRRPSPDLYAPYMLTPAQTRSLIAEYGWSAVAGFQTRNPIHRAHEYIQKCALEVVDGLLLHPLVGPTKSDDIPAAVRLESYHAILRHYYPNNRVLFAVYTAAMRYAGPREAIFHALVRKNFGCTHFVVGRDHAGVGSFYGTYDAQRIFREFDQAALGITPLFFEHAFYCRQCYGMATTKTCPHTVQDRVHLSGTKVRSMLQANQPLPKEFSRPEVVEVLQRYYQQSNGTPPPRPPERDT